MKNYKIKWNRKMADIDELIKILQSGEVLPITVHKNWKIKKGDTVELYDVTNKKEKPIFLGKYSVIRGIIHTTATIDKTWTEKGLQKIGKEVRPKVEIQKLNK